VEKNVKAAVIVDAYPVWVDAMSSLLLDMGIEVRGSAGSVADGRILVETHNPDLVILGVDETENESDIWELVRMCRQSTPRRQVVIIGSPNAARLITNALAEGVAAYCARTASDTDLEVAIRQSFETSISYALGGAAAPSPPPALQTESGEELTQRELQILELVAEGHSNAQLARNLWITEQTVKFHLTNIYRKLKVSNRTEASRWAQLHGLLPPLPQTYAKSRRT